MMPCYKAAHNINTLNSAMTNY